MTKLSLHPRVVALIYLLGGAGVVALVSSLGWMDSGRAGNKVILLFGLAGIASGVGLTQLLWPPKVTGEGDDRSVWQRASWPQRILWIIGGLVGVVAAAVTQTVLSGKI